MTLNPTSLLTFVKQHAQSTQHEVSAPEPKLTSFLIVDDEEPVGRLVARILGAAGFASVVACSGPDALAKMTDDQCPILVTDMMMPDMTGAELARRLRERNPKLKVLYLTGFADRLFDERSILWEDEAFLEKPFTAKGLLEAVALLTTGHPAVDALPQLAAEPLG